MKKRRQRASLFSRPFCPDGWSQEVRPSRRGGPMCPPHNWLPRRTVSGPTHRSAPTESIAMFISPGRAGGDRAPPLLVDRGAQQRAAEDASLYGCTTGGAQQRADVPKAWLPPTKFRAEIWGVSHRHRPLRKRGEAAATTRASGAQRSICYADGRKGWESRQRSSSKCPATSGNPSVALWATAPFTQGSLSLRRAGEGADTARSLG